MTKEEIYLGSLIFVGPSGAGKTTVAEHFAEKGLLNVCLDTLLQKHRDGNKLIIPSRFTGNKDKFYLEQIQNLINAQMIMGRQFVMSFGATQSCMEDPECFSQLKEILKPFKNIILLLPCEDVTESFRILYLRTEGRGKVSVADKNMYYLTSGHNKQLATKIIYTENKSIENVVCEISQERARNLMQCGLCLR